AAALPATFTRSPITIGLPVTIPATAVRRLTVTVTRRAVAEGLTIMIVGGRTVPLGTPVIAGTVATRVAAGVVRAAESTAARIPSAAKVAAVVAAAITVVVLSHAGFLLLRAPDWHAGSRTTLVASCLMRAIPW
ncbi:hypothetical protein ABIB29_004007, partial [Arthrobacter sp. UYEF36]